MKLMGILNATPDSFYAPSRVGLESRVDIECRVGLECREESFGLETGVQRGLNMVQEGAEILDIGGESTRPGSQYVEAGEEIRRVVPLIQALRQAGCGVEISVDTRKRAVAEAAVRAGAGWINDVSALEDDPDLAAFVADSGVKLVLMHRQGHPDTMQTAPSYGNVVTEVRDQLLRRVDFALSQGIHPEKIVLDPGFGFGKTVQNNVDLMRNLSLFCNLGFPVLVGVSRKSFLGSYTGAPAEGRLPASLAAAWVCQQSGVAYLRVHDVEPTRQMLRAMESFSTENCG